jgi:putative ABC transport system substrate-binding protein
MKAQMQRREFITLLGCAAAAWPIAARAQQPAMPVIGALVGASYPNLSDAGGAPTAAFRQGLGEHGYVEGRNVEILYRFAEYQNDRLPELAADLVRHRVSAILTGGAPATLAAKKATATIPIVFFTGIDPVQAGFVASLNRPGGNATGAAYLSVELNAKRLELVHEIAPAAKSIGYLYDPKYSAAYSEAEIKVIETAARTLGLRLVTAEASTPSEIERAFAMLVGESIGAFLHSSYLIPQRHQIIALAAHHALPAIYADRAMVEAGGLNIISYGGSVSDATHVAGTYVGRILKGEKFADLSVQQSTRTEMAINLKTAKALGLTIPLTLLAIADEVIE